MPLPKHHASLEPHHSIWLIPDHRATTRLTEFIKKAARTNGTLPFVPHITALAGMTDEPNTLRSKLETIISDFAPFPARAIGIGSAHEYYRLLFLRIAASAMLRTVQQRLRRILGGRPQRTQAHLSLAYGDYSASVLRQLRPAASPLRSIMFSITSVELMDTSGVYCDWRKIAAFRLEDRIAEDEIK